MVLSIVTSHRLEQLFDALLERLTDGRGDPMASDTIVVPGQGIARWLELRIAQRAGIAAGLAMPFFGAFLNQLTRPDDDTAGDPFAREVLQWRIWRLLGERQGNRDEKLRFGAANDYIRDDPDGSKRLQLSMRIAARFDDYQFYRDDLLAGFARGEDHKALSPHAPWQARLWRALLEDAGLALPGARRDRGGDATPLLFAELAEPATTGGRDSDAAHRLVTLHSRLDDDDWCAQQLPARLFVFGPTTMPPPFLAVLHHLARRIPVHVYVPQPTPHYMGELRARKRRSGDNALLARFGTESREFQELLLDLEDRSSPEAPVEVTGLDDLSPADEPADDDGSLLRCVQRDLVDAYDRGARGAERFRLRRDDDSLRVHDCHSPMRELEVVRDQICAALDRDRSLQPGDVLVLVPDIDQYAPYAHAVFGPLQARLPFHVADRHPASELPLCRSLLRVLELASSRLTLADVLHLLENPALQRRFGLFPSDVPVLRQMCGEASIRWGLDADSRERQFDLPAFADNAWQPGLDRLLLGTLTGPCDELSCELLPVGDTTDSRAHLLARFVTFTRTLFDKVSELRAPHPLADWADILDGAVEDLFAPGDASEENAIAELLAATVRLRQQARLAEHDEAVTPAVLRAWLADALAQGATSRGFLGGSITIAAMLPMRAVPVRCLFVCGLADESFPRRDAELAFDLIPAEPRRGDRNRRLDDRQLFLDLLLAARERLHLTSVGHSAKDNAEGAPSVVLSELLEHVDRTCATDDGREPSRIVVVEHPLQPWSERYHDGRDPRLFTYAGHRTASTSDDAAAALAPWCPPDTDIVPADDRTAERCTLDDLLQFWWHPCRAFLQRSMLVRVRADDEQELADEPFELDGLTRYRLQDEAVRRAQRGDDDPRDPLRLARAAGVLPVGAQGDVAFAALRNDSDRLLREARRFASTKVRAIDVRVAGTRIVGSIDGFGDGDRTYMRVSRLKPKDRLKAWIQHLAMTLQRAQEPAQCGDWPLQTRVLSGDAEHVYFEVPADDAERLLADLLQLYRVGLRRPLPFFEKSSFTVGEKLLGNADPDAILRAARGVYEVARSDESYRYDLSDEAIALCMRDRNPIGEGQEGEFFQLAERIWSPPLGYLQEVV